MKQFLGSYEIDLGHQHDEKQEMPSEAVEQIHFPHRCWPNN